MVLRPPAAHRTYQPLPALNTVTATMNLSLSSFQPFLNQETPWTMSLTLPLRCVYSYKSCNNAPINIWTAVSGLIWTLLQVAAPAVAFITPEYPAESCPPLAKSPVRCGSPLQDTVAPCRGVTTLVLLDIHADMHEHMSMQPFRCHTGHSLNRKASITLCINADVQSLRQSHPADNYNFSESIAPTSRSWVRLAGPAGQLAAQQHDRQTHFCDTGKQS